MTVPSKKEILDFSPMNRGEKEDLPAYRRKAFPEIKKALDSGLIVAVTGLRRVGKSTLMKQLFENAVNAFYFSFDEKGFLNKEALKKVVDVFLEEGVKPSICLDEIFRVEDWAGVLKKYHDQKKARFIVSGSSSLLIKKGVESLSGRLLERYLPPLEFVEYLELKGRLVKPSYNVFRTDRFEEELTEFLVKGSFPEIIGFDEKLAAEYIKTNTVEKIVFDDIPSAFGIKHASKLFDLFKLCATNSSHLFTETNLSEALQISRDTVSNYLLYLQKSYLVDVIYPTGSFQKALKKQKKCFVKTASVYNALAENPSVGQAAETAVFDKLSCDKTAFYRDAQKREVDFVWRNIPIEVKYQSTITSGDLQNLLYYMEQNKRKKGILVTKDAFDEKNVDSKKIVLIPLDAFLLSVPEALSES